MTHSTPPPDPPRGNRELCESTCYLYIRTVPARVLPKPGSIRLRSSLETETGDADDQAWLDQML